MTTETPDFADMVQRQLRAYARRVAAGDPVDLSRMVEVKRDFDRLVSQTVADMHEDEGWSWSQLGEALGITRQAAQQTYGGVGNRSGSLSVVRG